ncbi:ArdC-like ssDNA-binding domain-containing protein [Brenneria izbisi]|uniref:ArdC-like ssDNA-binding domain-containing protein n=1 Tax=Brenneria izbisi TaxID=2939450 RepID=A0AA42C5G1_9GAMM|nr:ArdC-like ssDNA-binding domain-containing protein [Brenneria izbisi]MCV9879234.1 ArdC-like ssDNA-binding domain-containing protein [Brenneria izbisi]MCV9882732.1 ArdC-like ssDNA-binding domain-containing protein [Brenneria izbisi]
MKTFTLQDAGDICRLMTGRLMQSVNDGLTPWRQDIIRHGIPVHALSGHLFTGINVLLLWQAALRFGLTSNRWLTGDDLRSMGGKVKQGHSPTTAVRYKPTLSLFRIINIEQCEGLPMELQAGWPWLSSPIPGLERVGEWQAASQVPILFRAQYPAVYLPESDRIELPGSDPDSLTALLIRATGHPARLGRFDVTNDLPEMNESLIADVGRAFLSALAGLHLAGEPMWNGELGSDPWLLFKSASDAGKAVGWLEAQRQAGLRSSDIQRWQQYAGQLMAEHYGQPLNDTTLVCESVVRQHLRYNTSPCNAVNALARLYDWPRSDMPSALFTPELNSVADALARFSLNPGSLAVHRVASDIEGNEAFQDAPELETLLLPPPSAAALESVAANDEGEGDDPDDPGNLAALPWVANLGRSNPHRATFIRQFREIAPYENRWTVFSDFIHMAAAALHNRCHFTQEIEDDYMRRIRSYKKADQHRFPVLFDTLVEGMEFSATDFLGSVFMELELGDQCRGQYFTPYSVAYMMAKMQLADGLPALRSGERDFVTVSDPACGAGGLVVAMAQAMLEAGFNPQKQMMAVCVDIDPVAAMMAYVQLALYGIPAMVIVGDTLRMEFHKTWRTPFWLMFGWERKWAREQERLAEQKVA